MSRKRARLEMVGGTGWAPRHDALGDGQNRTLSAARGERQLEERVLALRAGALTSRSFAAGYVESASRALFQARTGRNHAHGTQRDDHLGADHQSDAGRASRQARKCLRFARLCERRASSLATRLAAEAPAIPDPGSR